jgi:hypothetical protein
MMSHVGLVGVFENEITRALVGFAALGLPLTKK